ncbi:MAG: nucleoid-associated protein YgaU [Saprospiraceae bacterium]|jgi:nucleoid-associated protein YgaU
MGFFDFASNIGKKLFGDEDDPAEAIAGHINEDNPGVEGLKVEVKDGVASVKGVAKDQSAFEKAILMVGNVLGISEVKADQLVLDNTPAVPEEDAQYTIQKGDTLWAIAAEHLGNGSLYPEIVEANLEVIKDADLIFPGQKIRIPK